MQSPFSLCITEDQQDGGTSPGLFSISIVLRPSKMVPRCLCPPGHRSFVGTSMASLGRLMKQDEALQPSTGATTSRIPVKQSGARVYPGSWKHRSFSTQEFLWKRKPQPCNTGRAVPVACCGLGAVPFGKPRCSPAAFPQTFLISSLTPAT